MAKFSRNECVDLLQLFKQLLYYTEHEKEVVTDYRGVLF